MIVDIGPSGAGETASRIAATANVRKVPSPLLSQFLIPDFLSVEECAGLIERIDAGVRPSTIVDDIGDALFRTSMTCDLDHADPLVAAVNARLDDLTGIGWRHGEPLQGQRYDVGQEFKSHTDYFEPTSAEYDEHCAVPGNRTWTLMAYLNDVPAGGGTRFKATGKIHHPETGKLLAWCNVGANGFPNPHSEHHGMKVRRGRKYVITKWYREREWPWP